MRRERASCRPPSADTELSPLESERAARQASRSWSMQSSCSLFRPLGISPLGTPSMASSRWAAALFSASTVMPVCFRAPDAAACTIATESWPETAPVTRS
ncbi:hypothetical protein SRABI128_04142 [Microbacterium sp. Bi128]|nr:hypothetical protein SRABI128_04142 [Microbacterium sp. Bi128]